MSSYDFVPKTPSQSVALSMNAGPALGPSKSSSFSLQKEPSPMFTWSASKKEDPAPRNDLDLPGPSPTGFNLAPPPPSPEDSNGLGIEHKAMLTMGLSLLFDAIKDAAYDFSDFMQILNQQAAQKVAKNVIHAPEKRPELENLPIVENKPNLKLNRGQELDMLIPGPENSLNNDPSPDQWLSPQSPAKKAGLAQEIEPAPSRSFGKSVSPAPAPMTGFSPSM